MFEESVLLQCRCTADPIPSFTWTLDGKAIVIGNKYRQGILTEGNTHTIFLEVLQVTKKDSGIYKVTAKNNKGDGAANIELNIAGVEFKFVLIPFYKPLEYLCLFFLDYQKVLRHHLLVNQQLNKMQKLLLFKSISLLIQVHH